MDNKKIKPNEVLLGDYIWEAEDLKKIKYSIEDYKKEYEKEMKKIFTIRNYLKIVSSYTSEEESEN